MSDNVHSLQIERSFNAPLEAVWRCWSEPELLMQWFCPKPWRVTEARLDLQTGGEFFTHMQGPDGQHHDLDGLVLLVEPQRRIIFTDAFRKGWIPSARAFMRSEVTFEAKGEQTLYRASAQHWSAADKAEHEAMGFYAGWNAAADQLEALARSL